MKKFFLVGKGRIRGSYCDGFHRVGVDGTIGYDLTRKPTKKEKSQIFSDIQRHRAKLQKELENLRKAEEALQ